MPGRWWYVGLVALAVGVRIAAVVVLQSHTVPHSTFEHGEIAANLLAGRGFSIRFLGVDGPTSQQAPLYPALVAACYAVGGVESPRSLLILQLGQSALGGVLVAAVMALACQIVPGRPWLTRLAGLLVALHPTLVYAATHVQVALLAATLLVGVLALAYRTRRDGRWQSAALAGACLGILVLTDPILGLVVPGLFWAICWGQGAGKRTIRLCALSATVAAAVVAPWVVRNYRVHGEFVPVKSTFGYAFWQGNCDLSEGTDKVRRASVDPILAAQRAGLADWNRRLWEARHEAGYIDDIALTPTDYATLAQLTEPARSRLLLGRSLDDLKTSPGRYSQLCLRRLRYFLLFDDTNPKTRNVIYRASHLTLSLGALLGWLAMSPITRRRMAPTLLTVGLITLFHTLTIVSARFHIPIEPLLCLWCAAALAGLLERMRHQAIQRSAAPAHHIVRVAIEEERLAAVSRRAI